jgi:hypothetical protein
VARTPTNLQVLLYCAPGSTELSLLVLLQIPYSGYLAGLQDEAVCNKKKMHCFDADPEPDPDPAQNLDADPDPDPDPGGGGGGSSAKNLQLCIPPGKILGTPLELSYRTSRLHRLALSGRYNKPMPESTMSLSQGL